MVLIPYGSVYVKTCYSVLQRKVSWVKLHTEANRIKREMFYLERKAEKTRALCAGSARYSSVSAVYKTGARRLAVSDGTYIPHAAEQHKPVKKPGADVDSG